MSWALAEPAPFPSALGSALNGHTCAVCILRAKPLQGPGSLGHISRAARGPTASFLWMLWGLELKELCEAPMHTKQRLLRQLPLVCLRMPGAGCLYFLFAAVLHSSFLRKYPRYRRYVSTQFKSLATGFNNKFYSVWLL